jgi:UDP-N-acetylmuramyl-tripeptide synthetase
VEFASEMVGHHNLENMLCAAGVAVALGIPSEIIASGIERAAAAPGRLEPVTDPSGRFIFVDYAHTPDALENVLKALKALKKGRLICVFGCGGDRDRQKRPLMGAIAVNLSDLAVVTSDNPRSEAPLSIIEDIVKGIDGSADTASNAPDRPSGDERPVYIVEPDRRKAIHIALSEAMAGDIVLIAGKGHERYQIVGDRTLHFDDREEAMAVIQQSLQFSSGATTSR